MDIGSNVTTTGQYIETVRSLHQTVIALRTALEESKKEIIQLKSNVWPIESIEQSLTALAIENHALRRKLLENSNSELPAEEKSSLDKINIDDGEANVVPSKDSVTSTDILESNVGTCSPQLFLIRDCPEEKTNKTLIQEESSFRTKEFESDVNNLKQEIHDGNYSVNTVSQTKEKQSEKEKNSIQSDVANALLEQPETNKLQTDSQERPKPSLVNVEIPPCTQQIHKNNKLKKLNKVKEVQFSQIIKSKSVQDPKKAKKEKRIGKNQLKFPTVLGRRSVQKHKIKASLHIKAKSFDDKRTPKSLDSLTIVKTPFKELRFSKSTQFFNLNSKISCEITRGASNMSDNKNFKVNEKFQPDHEVNDEVENKNQNDAEQEPEVDDIELIFTTDDTKDSDFKEQLVSIDSRERQNNVSSVKLLAPDLEQSIDISDRELDDDVFGGSFDHENQECNLQVFQLERDNSQLYNSKSDNSINQEDRSLRSYYSYQDSSFENKSMEKDESFDRFEERVRIVETDISKVGIQEVEYTGFRRNTCPNPLQYRPLLHREAINKGLNVKKSRPILAHSNAIRKESGAQTDISALPGSAWRSESSLANKAHLGENFTTLPSKFPLPGSRIKLSEKNTVEARRVLLSDIGFTSMVPELSRSADHLCPSALKPPVTTYGQFLRTTDLYSPAAYTSQRFTWTTTTATPSDGSQSHSRYSINPLTPPVQTRRCSAPVSPSRRGTLKSTSRVRFANGSLPELRGDWTQITADSGDSTDSLVEEAENYLRRSIDCILGNSRRNDYSDSRRNILRRASAPESATENTPPQGWQPFLPRQPRDLKPDHWVKVITPEGKVRGGRVRYIGPVATQIDQFVGVQLAVPEGHTDGTYNARRYFQCEPYHGIFVSFKKVIMGWRP